ncbi:MAG: hypothetical protein AB7D29_03730 [Campylobacterales bacterium]
MKKLGLSLILSATLFSAEDFESYKQNVINEYNDYYQKEMKAFKAFVETADGIPNKVNPYQNMSVIPPKPVVKAPTVKVEKPIQPVAKPKNTMPDNTPSESQLKTVKINQIDPNKLTKPETPPVVKTPSVVTPQMFSLAFFGSNIAINPDVVAFTKKLPSSGDTSKIAENIKANDAALVKELLRAKAEYNLNDWDSFVLIQTLVNTLYAKEAKLTKTLHAIDLLRGMGYKARFAEGEDKSPYLLISIKQQVYSKSFYDKDGSRFYIFAVDAHPRANYTQPIYFFNSPDDGIGKPVDMVMHKNPNIGKNDSPIKLSWDFEGKQYQMIVKANGELAALMDMYPQADYGIYMQSRSGSPLVKEISSSLMGGIKKNNFSKEKAIAFVLRFSQKAFTYKTDFDAYGFERPFFVEQTILLPYSDCEDRATLLSHLYREIFGYDSVGLHYPGHMSLAVAYDGKGVDYYNIDGQKYYVTDGTYFYAPPGVSQPSFKGAKAGFVLTK